MITESTYRDRTTASRDLLAAFSSLDHATTAALEPGQVQQAYARLLRRLCVLAALHGGQVPARMLAAIRSGAGGQDVVDVAAGYIDTGTGASDDGPSEMQQELVHFSRIVDVGTLGLDSGVAEHALRRLRGSDRLPDPLKVLSELIIVTRSRLVQRGQLLPLPWLRPSPAAEADDAAGNLTTAVPAASPDYWMAVRSGRRRTRRDQRYLLTALLDYLTPAEAALALWAHCYEQRLGEPVGLAVVQADTSAGVTAVNWAYQPETGPNGDGDVLAAVARQLPDLTLLQPGESVLLATGGHRVRHVAPGTVMLEQAPSGAPAAVLTAPPRGQAVPVPDLAARARCLLAGYTGPPVISIEAGHIHLDRNLDVDQAAGAAIGGAALDVLGGRQPRPLLTPMMDDDHVLVRLTPAAYLEFLHSQFGSAPMHLICESSPIIRAIIGVLFGRLTRSPGAAGLQTRGGNLILPLPDGSPCELFEDFTSAAPVNGCVFFETALLVYRCDPARFDGYFADRYDLDVPVHDRAAEILSAPGTSAARTGALQAYYTRFADVTDPRQPDAGVTALVGAVLAAAAPTTAHMNVLEDYYETQQHRVRLLIGLLGLPLHLISLHFNATTGRVVLAGV